MKTNNQKKPKNMIFIIWGLFITGVILVFLIILLLAMNKPQPKEETPNQQHLNSKTNVQQEQETYNKIMNRIEKEIGELTNKKEIIYQPDGKTISKIEIKDADDNLIKRILYKDDGKIINQIKEFDIQTSKMKKNTLYCDDGKTISYILEFDPQSIGKIIKQTNYYNDGKTIQLIKEYNPQTNKLIKETSLLPDGAIENSITYNPDGTVKEIINS